MTFFNELLKMVITFLTLFAFLFISDFEIFPSLNSIVNLNLFMKHRHSLMFKILNNVYVFLLYGKPSNNKFKYFSIKKSPMEIVVDYVSTLKFVRAT